MNFLCKIEKMHEIRETNVITAAMSAIHDKTMMWADGEDSSVAGGCGDAASSAGSSASGEVVASCCTRISAWL